MRTQDRGFPNGPVGIPLFGVAALAALYLINRPFRSALYQIDVKRPKRFRRRKLVGVVRGRGNGCCGDERPVRALVDR